MSESDNLPQVLAAIAVVQQRILQAVDATAVEISHRVEQKAKRIVSADRKKVDGGYEPPYPAIQGAPPMKVTGNLRRGIKGEVKRHGFGIYVAEVNSQAIYSRKLEFGGHPFLSTAVEQFNQSNSIKRILANNIRKVTQ